MSTEELWYVEAVVRDNKGALRVSGLECWGAVYPAILVAIASADSHVRNGSASQSGYAYHHPIPEREALERQYALYFSFQTK